MGPGGEKFNPQQGPQTLYWVQPSQADRPAEMVGGGTAQPVFPAPAGSPQPADEQSHDS